MVKVHFYGDNYKTVSIDIAFKAAKISETVFEIQAAFVTRGVGEEAFSSSNS